MKLSERLNKKDLRTKCVERYGEEFGELYDKVNSGIPIGDATYTIIFLQMVEAVKSGRRSK